jgi:hypothetical protein
MVPWGGIAFLAFIAICLALILRTRKVHLFWTPLFTNTPLTPERNPIQYWAWVALLATFLLALSWELVARYLQG